MSATPSKRKRGRTPKDVTEHCCWSVNVAGVLEILSWSGVKSVVVSLDDREPPEGYTAERRLRVSSYTYIDTPNEGDTLPIPRTPKMASGGQT